MRRNLLTLMLGFTFLFFGMFVANTQASGGSAPNIKKILNQVSKSTNRIELTNKFNKAFSKMKEVCAGGNLCDDLIAASAQAFDDMIAACNYAETSSACANAEAWIEQIAEATLDECSRTGPSAEVLQRKDSFRFLIA